MDYNEPPALPRPRRAAWGPGQQVTRNTPLNELKGSFLFVDVWYSHACWVTERLPFLSLVPSTHAQRCRQPAHSLIIPQADDMHCHFY